MMVTDDIELTYVLKRVSETMTDFKSNLSDRAALRNLATLSPVLFNKTR